QEGHRRPFLHQHDIVLTADELREVLEVPRQLELMPPGRELWAVRDPSLRERIEKKHRGRAAFGLSMNAQFVDESGIETGGAPALPVERDSFGAAWRERVFQLPTERGPIVFRWILPAPKPFESVGDVADLVLVDLAEQTCGLSVSHRLKPARELTGKVQVGLLEGQAQPRDIIQRAFHRRERAPEVAADRQFAKPDPTLAHPAQILTH